MKPDFGLLSTQQHRFHPRYQGCIGHWIFSEAGGGTLYDVSGNAENLTINGNPTWATGKEGSALVLDGTGDYGSRSIDNLYNISQGTILARARRDAATGEMHIFSVGDGSLNGDFFCSVEWAGTDDSLQIFLANGSTYDWRATSSSSFPTGTFYDFALLVDGTGNNLYVDSVLQSLTYSNGSSASTQFLSTYFAHFTTVDIGRLNSVNFPSYLTGAVEYVKVYNRALSVAEVLSHDLDPYLEFGLSTTAYDSFTDLLAAAGVFRLRTGVGA